MAQPGSSKPKVTQTPPVPSTSEDLEALAWKIRDEVGKEIPPLRSAAYAIAGYGGKPGASPALVSPPPMPGRNPGESLDDWSARLELWAIGLEQRLQASSSSQSPSVVAVLNATEAAGHLLGAVERILLSIPDDPAAKASEGVKGTIASRAFTIVATARDHADAADGLVKNLRNPIGDKELGFLVGWLTAAVFAYTAFHPAWGWLAKMPSESGAIWEVIFWSLFGSVADSYLRVAEDIGKETFDPRHPYMYIYRVVTAPLVALVVVFLWSVTGLALSSSSSSNLLSVGGLSPTLLVLIVVSFLLGFYSKRALQVLDQAWQRVSSSGNGGGTSKQS